MSLRHPAVLWLSWLAHVKVLQLNVWVAGKKGERLTTHFVVCMTWACSSYASKHSLVYPPPFRLLIFYCCVFFPFPPAFLFLSCMHAPCSASTTTSSSTVKFACCWVYVDLCVICLLAPPCRKTKPPNLAGSPNHVCDIASFNTSTEMCGLGAVTTRQRSGGRERERERERECVCVCVCVCARADAVYAACVARASTC